MVARRVYDKSPRNPGHNSVRTDATKVSGIQRIREQSARCGEGDLTLKYDRLKLALRQGLALLDQALIDDGLTLRLLLGGASAMKIAGLTSRDSRDLDNLIALSNAIIQKITEIAQRLDLDADWLNDQAFDIPLPSGAELRLVKLECPLKAITIEVLSRGDLITMKVNAAVTRGEARDYDDLRNAVISPDEFEVAVSYIREKQRPDDPEFRKYQDQDIEVLRAQLFR